MLIYIVAANGNRIVGETGMQCYYQMSATSLRLKSDQDIGVTWNRTISNMLYHSGSVASFQVCLIITWPTGVTSGSSVECCSGMVHGNLLHMHAFNTIFVVQIIPVYIFMSRDL